MSDEIKNPNAEDEYQPDLMTLQDEDGNEVTRSRTRRSGAARTAC